jgi:glycosyltransferase involved in cell wall biosynthesis
MNCCICGPVKNCGPYLSKVLDNMEKFGSLFNDYQIMIYYDKSTDNTLQILKQYQLRNPKMLLYINKNPVSPFRTHNIAIARNVCLNYVRVRLDLVPKMNLDAHKNITKSRLVFKQYFKPDGTVNVVGRYEDCEHRAFHIQARQNSGARIMISHDILFY